MVREDSNNDDNSSADESENADENDDGDIDDDVGGNKRKKTKGEEEHKFRWRKRDVTTTPDKVFQPEVANIKETKTPIEYFRQFWTDDIIDLVVQQTNLYSRQKTGFSINTTKEETEQLMGMHLRACTYCSASIIQNVLVTKECEFLQLLIGCLSKGMKNLEQICTL